MTPQEVIERLRAADADLRAARRARDAAIARHWSLLWYRRCRKASAEYRAAMNRQIVAFLAVSDAHNAAISARDFETADLLLAGMR